jgi:phage shock protein C
LAADGGPAAPAAPVVREMVDMSDGNGNKVLRRSRSGRMVAGVCAGAAEYFGIDVTLVRVIVAVVAVITGGAGVLAYLAAWVIIPGEGENTSIAENIVTKKQDASASR